MLVQRVREQQVTVKHVPDVHMPADLLTKWINNGKVNQSVKYATGQITMDAVASMSLSLSTATGDA